MAELVWDSRYRLTPADAAPEENMAATWRRVATAVGAVECGAAERATCTAAFNELLEEGRFFPGGRILANAGAPAQGGCFNCFVAGPVRAESKMMRRTIREATAVMGQGGGIGFDFSDLPPRSAGTGEDPLAVMAALNFACEQLLGREPRRGAMLAGLRCDHPDIVDFVDAKRAPGVFTNFNCSVLVTNDFLRAVEQDGQWRLGQVSGGANNQGDGSTAIIGARELWERIIRSAYECAEPGVLFIDRVNADNNLHYCERLVATNPCGEVPLPHHGGCNLGSLNLPRFVVAPFTIQARLDLDALTRAARLAVRFLDNVLEVSRYPSPVYRQVMRQSRRIGLGVTGLADMLVMLGLDYGSGAARRFAEAMLRQVTLAAYEASVTLARQRGSFPAFRAGEFLAGSFSRRLPGGLRHAVGQHGLRNSHLLALAPAGTISLLAGNVSSGIEPIYALRQRRRYRPAGADAVTVDLEDYAHHCWRVQHPDEALPTHWRTATTITPADHLRMQAALQRQVDNAIAKTVNVPVDCSYATFADLFDLAIRLDVKGFATFRPNPARGEVLQADEGGRDCRICCYGSGGYAPIGDQPPLP
ncbi:MAG: adenosylcobalamin-dependent ribonucleoside-diphosphate reductase [Pseudomonadota bacterium]|nr:adenosylcobalamin-dependent ribonucleoside-diphosphate reductase [Pseudomonadota bacterium]